MGAASPLTGGRVAACVDANAAALGLAIAPEHRPGVLRYFALAAEMAALVQDWPLAHADEPAPVFTPAALPADGGEPS